MLQMWNLEFVEKILTLLDGKQQKPCSRTGKRNWALTQQPPMRSCQFPAQDGPLSHEIPRLLPAPRGSLPPRHFPQWKALVPPKLADYKEFQMAVFVLCQRGLHHSPKSRFVSATMA